MSDSSLTPLQLSNDYMGPPPPKRRCISPPGAAYSPALTSAEPMQPLSNPFLPDDVWRMIFHYLDVGHVCTRMAVLNKNWSKACWRVVSAYVPGDTRSVARPAQFKYRPTGYLNRLVHLPSRQYLRTLTLDSLKLTESEVAPLYNFSGLVSLQLVVVRGRAFQNLSRLVSLRSLTTWNCEWVNSEVLMQIGRLERLEHLTLNCCDQINDEGLKHLSTLTNLLSLGLTDLTVISEVGLRHLSTLTNLGTLTLAFNPVSDEMVKVIAEHHTEKLQVLDLDAASLGEGRITDAGLAVLGKLTKLRRLKLGYHSFTSNGLSGLSGLTNLESLSLESVEGCVTGDSLKTLSKLVHLRKLNLDSCPTFDDNAMSALVHFTELEHLNIAKTMVKRGLQYLSSETHPKLTYLDMSYSEKLDDAGLKYITRLSNLSSLHLFRCPRGRLSSKGTKALLELRNLDLLDCRECPISKDVAKILRGRIKDMREDLGNLNSVPIAGQDDAENEELPDSDDEAVVIPTMSPLGSQHHEVQHQHHPQHRHLQPAEMERQDAVSHRSIDPSSSSDPIGTSQTQHTKDDIKNYMMSDDESNDEVEEMDWDSGSDLENPDRSAHSTDYKDEGEDVTEADDRLLLAAIRAQRTRNIIRQDDGQIVMTTPSSVSVTDPHRASFESEELP